MNQVQVFVFHNQSGLALMRGLQRGDRLKCVFVHELKNVMDVKILPPGHVERNLLIHIFWVFNERPPATYGKLRSLSSGDVLTLVTNNDSRTTRSYTVEDFGWKTLPQAVYNDCLYGIEGGLHGEGQAASPAPHS